MIKAKKIIHIFHNSFRTLVPVILLAVISGCATGEPFEVKNIIKSNIDMVADDSLNEMTKMTKLLAVKLYKRNPMELKKNNGQSIEERINEIFICPLEKTFTEIHNRRGTDAILLGFEKNYSGDRVFALIYGLYGIILDAYNNHCEFYMINSLDQQKLFNSARNMEILAWRLKNRRKENGDLFLITNETDGQLKNLSFERLFGKMIAVQDLMAIIMADKTNRIINEVVYYAASSAFLPMGL